jgi:tRNA(Ile)-lysidine synthase
MLIALPEFEQSMGNVGFPVAVAVSGGADSLALLLLAHELAQKKGSHVIALTVDHGLRSESKEEAIRVGKWAKEKGIQHVTLEWDGDKPSTRLQEKARKARYALLTQWCQQHQISTLLLGHHQQDQEETFWLRLSSGSGLEGLAGMKRRVVRDGILILRPLLDFPKERLKQTLLEQNQEWIEDPSNQNSGFFRGRLRQVLSEEGLSPIRLSQIMKKFQMDADFIQNSLTEAISNGIQTHESGYLTVKKESFNILHPAIAKRLISFLMQWFSNADYSPRATQVTGVMDKIKRGSSFTAGGIYWSFSRKGIFLFRERRAVQQEIPVSQLQGKILWDQRFWVDPRLSQYVSKDIIVGPLGAVSFSDVIPAQARVPSNFMESNNYFVDSRLRGDDIGVVFKGYSSCPKNIKSLIPPHGWPTLPALWEKGNVVAVPHLCYDLLKCGTDLRKFIYLKPLFHDSLRFTI